MLIAFAIMGLMFSQVIGTQVWMQMTGKSSSEMSEGFNHPAYGEVMKISQSIMFIVGFIIPTFLAAFLLSKRPIKLLGFSSGGIRLRQVGLTILLIGTSLIVSSALSYFTNILPIPNTWRMEFDKMELNYNNQVSAIISLKNAKDFILALIIMAFLPALGEETLFRGGLQNFLTRGTNNPWLSIIVVSILFSLVHISFYGFLSRVFLGIVLGALFYYSGKLWLSIIAHFINNALAITVLYVSTQQGKPLQEAIKQDPTSYWGILAVPVVIVLFVAFKRASTRQRIA